MEEKEIFSLLSDQPVKAGGDKLAFKDYAATLAAIIQGLDPRTPLTVGVFGDWGSGKTTLLQMVEEQLQAAGVKTIWVNVWQFSNEDDLWNAFLQAVVNKVQEETPLERRFKFNVRLLWSRIDWSALPRQIITYSWRILVSIAPIALARLVPAGESSQEAILAAGGLASVALSLYLVAWPFIEAITKGVSVDFGSLLKASPYQERITILEQFKVHFEDMVEALVGPEGRLVVFIDDLDRCPPERLVQVLDAIKLFVDTPRGVYVLGLDQDIVEQAVRKKYAGYKEEDKEAREYLEKIIQLPFNLPQLTGDEMKSYVSGLDLEMPDERCDDVFALGLEPNPRRVKRTINARQRIKKLPDIQPVLLAKVVVIQHSYPELYAVLRDFPGELARWEDYFLESDRAQKTLKGEAAKAEADLPERPERLSGFENIGTLRRLLTPHLGEGDGGVGFAGLSRNEIQSYFTLTRSVSMRVEVKDELLRHAYEPELIRIPAGIFTMGTSDEHIQWFVANTDWAAEWEEKGWFNNEQPSHEVELQDYRIGRTPVTNAEYGRFVQSSGKAPPSHWEGGTYPEELSDHPVVEVSWDDAVAYCEWLTEETGKRYRLPTEAEWEKAARGEDGRFYPWGNEWDKTKCNASESGVDDTTPVGQYSPEGDSLYGCTDMAGNVWEWCADWYDGDEYDRRAQSDVKDPQGPKKGDSRVLRGGSLGSVPQGVRCAYRYSYDPDYGGSGGFRVVVSPSNSDL